VERVRSAPVYVEGLSLRPGVDETKVLGRLKGSRSEAGNLIRLRFTFYGDDGVVGSTEVSLPAPAEGVLEPFEVAFRMKASSYSYVVLP
jgi:hypothetical protein